MPEQGRRIRAKAIIVGFIFTARFDEQLQREVTDTFFVNSVDVAGSLPKFAINAVTKNIPLSWFSLFEKESQRFEQNELREQD